MTMAGFVQAVGAMLGSARDAHGPVTAGEIVPAGSAPSAPGGAEGSGLAADASNTASGRMDGHAVALSELDAKVHGQVTDMLASKAAGRARMDGIISGATTDVQTLAPASNTPHGQRALVTALTRHLQNAKQTLQDSGSEASTHAAASNTTAAEYHSVAQYAPSGSAASASPLSGAPMAAMPLAGLGGLPGMMGSQPGGQSTQQKDPRTGVATDGSVISAVVQRALSQHGTPYVWGGGGPGGPTNGGFDCSSLMQYAFAGAGVHLPRTTYDQIGLGQSVSPGAIQAGDLIFSNFGEGGVAGPGHVQLAISPTHVVEAPHTGASVQISPIPSGHKVVRRILS
jgi:cell wall-associated NlpC family hydrolase